MSLATVIATLNEEVHVERAIASARPIGRVFVVDSGSEDLTAELARIRGAVVWEHPWAGYATQKNWAREQLPDDIEWVLHLDADEYLTPILRQEIMEAISAGRHRGFYLPRRNVFLGKDLKHSWWYPDFQLRLFQRDAGRYEDREVHEHLILDGEAGFLENPLIHENRKSIDEFLSRHMRYAALEAREILESRSGASDRVARTGKLFGSWPERRRALKTKVWYRLQGRPLIRFIWMFMVRGGFRDGRQGLVYCQLLSAYEAMIDARVLETEVTLDEAVLQESGDLRDLLACPACGARLNWRDDACECATGTHRYPIIEGVPVLLQSAERAPEATADYKDLQATFFDEGDGPPAFELARPRGTPRLYRWMLAAKFARGVDRIEHLLPGATAVAVCGGSGMDGEYLARAGANVISADISLGAAKRAAERARQHSLPMLSVVADVERLPLTDHSVDIAYVHDGLHHLEDPMAGLREMARVSRRAISVTEPAAAIVTTLAVRLGLALEKEEAGNRVARMSLRAVREVSAKAGFSVVQARRYGLYYRHEPALGATVFSMLGLYSVARLIWTLAATRLGRWGNKMTLQGIRPK